MLLITKKTFFKYYPETKPWFIANGYHEEEVPVITSAPVATPIVPEYTIEDCDMYKYATVDVNVRTEPSTNAGRVGSVDQNGKAHITGKTSNGWYRLEYNGVTGFSVSKYFSDYPIEEIGGITDVPEPTPEPTHAPTAEPTSEPVAEATKAPAVEPTEAPTATEMPQATDVPQATETPVAEPTEEPNKTKTEIVEPMETSEPMGTNEPTATDAPQATEAPADSDNTIDATLPFWAIAIIGVAVFIVLFGISYAVTLKIK